MIARDHPVLRAEIAEVDRIVFSGPCERIVAPAALGEVCILPRHAPLLARLSPGVVRITDPQGARRVFFVAGGYLEVFDSVVSILADQILRTDEIDRNKAIAAKQAAEALLNEPHLTREWDEARVQVARAMAQLRALEIARAEQRLGRLRRSV